MTYPQQFQPTRRRVWPWIAGGFAALALLGCGAGASYAESDTGAPETATATATKKADKPRAGARKDTTPGLNQPAKDGDFQFKGKLVFDVPKGTTLTTLDLHDSLFSGGVKVVLQ